MEHTVVYENRIMTIKDQKREKTSEVTKVTLKESVNTHKNQEPEHYGEGFRVGLSNAILKMA